MSMAAFRKTIRKFFNPPERPLVLPSIDLSDDTPPEEREKRDLRDRLTEEQLAANARNRDLIVRRERGQAHKYRTMMTEALSMLGDN